MVNAQRGGGGPWWPHRWRWGMYLKRFIKLYRFCFFCFELHTAMQQGDTRAKTVRQKIEIWENFDVFWDFSSVFEDFQNSIGHNLILRF